MAMFCALDLERESEYMRENECVWGVSIGAFILQMAMFYARERARKRTRERAII